ncbi:MAG: dihydrodipicolinate synthase family protein [Calditrichaeota bacterium]|nr:dihydrodipicolinate synthase family protein [Calditrichota bacterium]
MSFPELPQEISTALHAGQVIPAHPLALTASRTLDERHQRALTRYYLDSGAGGIAIGVHTTQFEIRDPKIGLYKPVLKLANEEIDAFVAKSGKPIIKIAGIAGRTEQAVKEAEFVAGLGYHAGLISLAALTHEDNEELLKHCRTVSQAIPLIGFYLQRAVGGRKLDVNFWREFSNIENVVAIKMAPFNRYDTLDVVRGVAESGRADQIALYTGNDDNIIADLLTKYSLVVDKKPRQIEIVGGLLGHWAVWTKKVVEIFNNIKKGASFSELLTLGTQITDCNAAFFDVAHDFSGCIVGIHEVLRKQGLLQGIWTLNPDEQLSAAQKEEIDRVYAAYPELNDDDFVAENLQRWLT